MSNTSPDLVRIKLLAENEHEYQDSLQRLTALGAVAKRANRSSHAPRIAYAIEVQRSRAKDLMGFEPPIEWEMLSPIDSNLAAYLTAFDALLPDMKRFLRTVAHAVQEQSADALTASEPYAGGDEEFRLSMDWRAGEDFVAGLDVTLNDAAANGDPDDEGFALTFELQGDGGQYLTALTPENLTDFLFTTELDVLRARINEMEQGEASGFAGLIIEQMPPPKPESRPSQS